jgi:uncharacterized Zn finger protein
MKIPALSEAAIRQYVTAQSFQRGQDYYRQGAVISLVQREDELQAQVEGSQYTPYQVRITFDAGGITGAICSCPYDWGGWCKHIVATLLACLHEPEEIESRPGLEELLADLDREQLQGLLLNLAGRSPELVDEIEARLALLRAGPADSQAAPSERRTPVDPQPFRRQVRPRTAL